MSGIGPCLGTEPRPLKWGVLSLTTRPWGRPLVCTFWLQGWETKNSVGVCPSVAWAHCNTGCTEQSPSLVPLTRRHLPYDEKDHVHILWIVIWGKDTLGEGPGRNVMGADINIMTDNFLTVKNSEPMSMETADLLSLPRFPWNKSDIFPTTWSHLDISTELSSGSHLLAKPPPM